MNRARVLLIRVFFLFSQLELEKAHLLKYVRRYMCKARQDFIHLRRVMDYWSGNRLLFFTFWRCLNSSSTILNWQPFTGKSWQILLESMANHKAMVSCRLNLSHPVESHLEMRSPNFISRTICLRANTDVPICTVKKLNTKPENLKEVHKNNTWHYVDWI